MNLKKTYCTFTITIMKYCNSVKTVDEQEMLMLVVLMSDLCTIFIQFDSLLFHYFSLVYYIINARCNILYCVICQADKEEPDLIPW